MQLIFTDERSPSVTQKKGGQACCSYLIILTCDQGHAYLTYQNGEQLLQLARSLSKIPRCSALSRKLVLVVVCICVHEVYSATFCKSDPPCYLLIRCLCPQLCNLFLTLRIDEVYESATTLSGKMENISKISALLHFFLRRKSRKIIRALTFLSLLFDVTESLKRIRM